MDNLEDKMISDLENLQGVFLGKEPTNDLYFPHAESLELRKLEFDEPCLGYYVGKCKEVFVSNKDVQAPFAPKLDSKIMFRAPLRQQAFDFFREKYKLKHDIDDNGICTKFYYRIKSYSDMFCNYEDILKPMQKETDWEKIEFKSYREAELQSILEEQIRRAKWGLDHANEQLIKFKSMYRN